LRQADLALFRLGLDRIRDCLPPAFCDSDEPPWAVHCATYGALDRCFLEREASRRVNVDATLRLLDELDQLGLRQVYLSTSYVFDGERGDYSETDRCSPISEYGRQKREVELWILEHLPQALILRLDKTVGSDPQQRHLFSEWWELVRCGQPILCIADQLFAPTLVNDVAHGIRAACQRRLTGLYHLANSERFYRDQLASEFLLAVGESVPVQIRPQAEFGFADRRPQRTTLNTSRFRQATHLEFTPIREVLRVFAERLRRGD